MNRKHSNSGRSQGPQSQASMRGNRSPMNSQSQYGRNFGASNDTDFDYDLDGSSYGSRSTANLNGRSPSSYNSDSTYGGEMGDYDTNERIRPSRFSSNEDRSDSNTSDRGHNRQSSSSERFGYPSNMNAWSGRMGQSDWAQDSDLDLSGSMDSQRGHFGKGPKGYKRSDDRIKEEVCETLARHPRIDASDIEVEVSDSMVTLSGTVESKDIRRAAEIAIENLSGIDEVKNEIRVKKADSLSASPDSNFASSTSGKHSKTSASSFKGSGQNS